MINKISAVEGVVNNKHELNKIHKKKNTNEDIISSFQSILDEEKIKYDERVIDKNIK